MKTICFIVVYIGKLPSYFDLWLASCRDNITVDFYMVTDQEKPTELPQNVYWVNTDFDNVKKRFQSVFDFLIISTPMDTSRLNDLLGDGFQFGIDLSYAVNQINAIIFGKRAHI